MHSVPAAYRDGGEMGEEGATGVMGGRVGWLISDAAERAIRLLTDENGRPLWAAANDSIASVGGNGTILGFPYMRSNVLGAADGTLKSNSKADIFFGNFSYFGIRTVNSFETFRFWDSNSAENNEVEIIGFSRRFGRTLYDGPSPAGVWPGIPMIKTMKIK